MPYSMQLAFSTRPLLPSLACVGHPKIRINPAGGFVLTDRVHVKRACEDFNAGTILPLLGYLLCTDERGEVYAAQLYVPGIGMTAAGRDALRFPSERQQEVLFQELPPFITALDLTDHADSLALERLQEAVVIPMYPTAEHRRLAA